MKFENKIQKLGITQEVESIIANCECGEIISARIVELSKLRNWEIREEIVNFFDGIDKDGNEVEIDNYFYCNLKSLCETFGFERSRLSEWYARAISEWGYEIAYPINDDVVLILE